MAHAGGRPTIYKDIYIDKIPEYIKTCTGREQTELPTVEGFADYIDVDTDTINNWCDAKDEKEELKHPEFFGAIKRLKDRQKNQLMNDGMYGGKEVNAGMAIFLLKANHGLIETGRTELVGKDGKPITVNILNDYLSTSGIDATPISGIKGPDTLQSTHLAQESTQNINTNREDGDRGTQSAP
jgi:hypothetical protein